jgi:hypothetical protein
VATIDVSAGDVLAFRDQAGAYQPTHYLSAGDALALGDLATTYQATYRLSAADVLAMSDHPKVFWMAANVVGWLEFLQLSDLATVAVARLLPKVASDGVKLSDRATAAVQAVHQVGAGDLLSLRDRAVPTLQVAGQPVVSPQMAREVLRLTDKGTAVRDIYVSASDSLALSGPSEGDRAVDVEAHDLLRLTDLGRSNQILPLFASDTLSLADQARITFVGFGQVDQLILLDRADARICLAGGGGPPGDVASGLRNVLYSGLVEDWPVSWTETPNGLILMANGIDPMFRIDVLKGEASEAGVTPPSAPPALGGFGVGPITGQYNAYVRFLDSSGTPSNLSPVSNAIDCGLDGVIESIYQDAGTGLLVVICHAHGLPPGGPVPITISGVVGIPGANTQWLATVIDDAHFYLSGVAVPPGTYQTGGTWTFGVATIAYSSVAVSDDPRIVRRQILRNLDGDASVYYVDIDSDDLVSDTFFSQQSDEQLSAGDPVPILYRDESPHANRYGVPPSHKACLAGHLGRIFAAGEVTYDRGSLVAGFNSTILRGIQTQWRGSFVGRVVYVVGATRGYEIAAVDEAGQTITLIEPFTDPVGPIAQYAIRPALAERRLMYYSEPSLPESWPAWNAVAFPEDGDEITGLLVKGSFLYVLERRHIYRFTFQEDPSLDGFAFLTTQRGCLNHRSQVQAEDTCYLLDDTGIYKFDGQTAEAISQPIQQIFQQGVGIGRYQVNWDADQRLWHAAHDPIRDTIRWFVAMAGWREPRHAICFDYRRERWWIEEYPAPLDSSTIGTIGHRRSLAGSTGRRVLCLSEATLDGIDSTWADRGVVGSAGPAALIDPAAQWSGDLAGTPVQIVAGKGAGQARVILGVDGTGTKLFLDRPWQIIPDGTATYQIGGVAWRWQSGWYALTPDETENPRDLDLVYEPLELPTTVDAELYYDHAAEPRSWSITTEQDGVTTTAGEPTIRFGLDTPRGFSRQRLAGHADPYAYGDQFVSVRLSGVQATEPVQVYSVVLKGAQTE